LKRLHNSWRFKPDGKSGCLVDFLVDFTFRSRTFEAIAGRMFGEAVRKMVAAFEARAVALYEAGEPGSSRPSAQSAA
jgi:coenzyme Q-binding protein COQ10